MNYAKRLIDIYYFGTALNVAGHYFWELSGEIMTETRDVWFNNIPFDPENIIKNVNNGTVKYLTVEDYYICAIEGSCFDKRPGSHSIFWTKNKIEQSEFKEFILSIPIAKKIIDQMTFDVNW